MAETLALAVLPNLFSAIESIVKHIDKAVEDRAERRRMKKSERMHQLRFLDAFAMASGPGSDDEHEALTIRQYCQRICDLIQTHRHYLWKARGDEGDGPAGGFSASSALALMAAQFAVIGLGPGIPQMHQSLPGPPHDPVTSSTEQTMVDTYQQEYEILRRTFDLILNAPDFELRPIRIDLESSESRLRVGISLGPAEKITQNPVADFGVVGPQPGIQVPVTPVAPQTTVNNLISTQNAPHTLHPDYPVLESSLPPSPKGFHDFAPLSHFRPQEMFQLADDLNVSPPISPPPPAYNTDSSLSTTTGWWSSQNNYATTSGSGLPSYSQPSSSEWCPQLSPTDCDPRLSTYSASPMELQNDPQIQPNNVTASVVQPSFSQSPLYPPRGHDLHRSSTYDYGVSENHGHGWANQMNPVRPQSQPAYPPFAMYM